MLDQKEALKLATVKTIFSDVANVGRIAGPETTQFRDVQKFISSAIMFHQVLVAVKEIDKWKQSETLANKSGNLGVENSKGQTLLHICTSRCYHEAMSQLLDLGEINVDHQGKSGNTALHGVVNKSGPYSISMAIDLLKASANPTIKNGERESPLDISGKSEQDNKQINPMLMEELQVVREGGGGGACGEGWPSKPWERNCFCPWRRHKRMQGNNNSLTKHSFCGKEWITARNSYSALWPRVRHHL